MNLVTICEWKGNNFGEIVSAIAEVNTEAMIRILGKRIIIQDRQVDYYQNVVIGDVVEIPIYEECLICDEIETEPEFIQPKYIDNTELSNNMLRTWGLIP